MILVHSTGVSVSQTSNSWPGVWRVSASADLVESISQISRLWRSRSLRRECSSRLVVWRSVSHWTVRLSTRGEWSLLARALLVQSWNILVSKSTRTQSWILAISRRTQWTILRSMRMLSESSWAHRTVLRTVWMLRLSKSTWTHVSLRLAKSTRAST